MTKTLTVKILPGECWWGGTTLRKFCPITGQSRYLLDMREGALNQTAPFFVSSEGRYLFSAGPFRIEALDGELRLEGEEELLLSEEAASLREAYLLAQKRHFPCDGAPLCKDFFRLPQFNSWIQFTYDPTQEGVLRYAREILGNGYEPGIFILDEGWTEHTAYGTWEFDRSRFPDPGAMVAELHRLGFRVMLWVTPFVSPNGPAYVRSRRKLLGSEPGEAERLYLRTDTGEVALVRWWNGVSAILDMTDEVNRRFLERQLTKLQNEYGIDGFKFDGGTTEHYGDVCCLNGRVDRARTPAERNRAWNEFGRRYAFHEFKDTYFGGGRNGIQRLHDRDHSWTGNGIGELIPCAAVCGLIGHPFVCPDMVGGGEWQNRVTPGFTVDEELFVRMAQCSALFPMMQFSWAPWEALSPENARLCLEAARLHSSLADEIVRLAEAAEQSGEPLVRLLEYADPHQGFAEIDDEFLLGEDILSAPVIAKGTREREVVFPAGRWTDAEGRIYEGRRKYLLPAPLETLLWFRRIR